MSTRYLAGVFRKRYVLIQGFRYPTDQGDIEIYATIGQTNIAKNDLEAYRHADLGIAPATFNDIGIGGDIIMGRNL